MSQSAIPFIGRNSELEIIRENLGEWGSQKIIFISGNGGVGKTRLLQEVEERIVTWNLPFACKGLSIIDFDDPYNKNLQNVMFAIAQQLGQDIFEQYFELVDDLRIAEKHWGLRPTHKWMTVVRAFIECFTNALQKDRIILPFDTIDVLKEASSLSYMFEDIVPYLPNILVLVAGRDAKTVYEKYKNDFPSSSSIYVPLKPFDLKECRDYLQEKQQQLQTILDKDWLQKLFVLANGVPVLIDMAIEWAAAHRKIELIEKTSFSELEELSRSPTRANELKTLQELFQKAIIIPIADLRSNLDQLKFLLAKIKPLDEIDIQELLNLSSKEALQVMAEAKRSVAIKLLPDGRIKLHDEVERLVEVYVWPMLDPDHAWEKRDSQRAITHLIRKSEKVLTEITHTKEEEVKYRNTLESVKSSELSRKTYALEQQFWALRLEALPRQLELDVFKGYEQFSANFEIARVLMGDSSSRFALLETISGYARLTDPITDINGLGLDEQKRLYLSRLYAREMTHSGMYKNAAKIYEEMLAKTPPDTEEYLDTLRECASQLVRAGKIRQAESQIDKGLRKAEELEFPLQRIKFQIDRGWVHRLSGNLDQALNYYNQALRSAFESDVEERIALVCSQKAYVLALQHKDKDALTEIRQSIELWQILWQQRDEYELRLGQAWNIAGEIHIEAERPQDAISCFERSFEIFEREEGQGFMWRSRSRSGRGFAYWLHANALRKSGELSTENQYFEYAYKDLKWACGEASYVDAPSMLNRFGEVCFAQEKYSEAEKAWQDALVTAKDIGDAFNELNSLGNLARLAFVISLRNFPQIEDFEYYYRRDFRHRYPMVQFTILDGLLYTYLGHLALKQLDIDKALNLYQRGMPLLSQINTYAFFNLPGQLTFIESEIIPQLSPQLTRELGKHLREWWLSNNSDITIALAYFRRWGLRADSVEVNYA